MICLISALFFMQDLSACDKLNLISRDFSVPLKSIDGGTTAVGKAVNCTFSVNGLDPDNGDQLLTMFDIEGGNGVFIVDNSEYSPGESFEYDYKVNGKLSFDFVPTAEGDISLKISVASEMVTRADSVRLDVSTPDMNVESQNVPDMVSLSDNVGFNLLLATDQYGVKASVRFSRVRHSNKH